MRTIFVIFPGFQLLDLSGPAAVFGAATEALSKDDDVLVVSAIGGPIRSSCGVSVASTAICDTVVGGCDTLLVVGGEGPGLRAVMADLGAGAWFTDGAATARRFGSVCTGSFALAAWGLVAGRRVATHWRGACDLAKRFPDVIVDAEALFIEDGRLWTSAGVTTGIDMALAMVERDHGPQLANGIARRLVLSVRRPGNQSQFSPMLGTQAKAGGRYADLVGYIAANLERPLDVETLASLAGEAPRSFHRHFSRATGTTPAAFVATARLDRVRVLLAEGAPVKLAASACGYATSEHLTRSFSAAFGLSPSAYRALNFTASAQPRR